MKIRRFVGKRRRKEAKALADASAAKHLGREDRDIIQEFWSVLKRRGACHVTFDQAEVITMVRDR